ncbi:MAG: hypothetical protein ACRDSL_16425 [Pseudonocardiaceae bacterium]
MKAAEHRLRWVPFDVIIPAAERDPELPHKLAAERDGILTWLIEGCQENRPVLGDGPDCHQH